MQNFDFEVGIHYKRQDSKKDENPIKKWPQKWNIDSRSMKLIENQHREKQDFLEKYTKKTSAKRQLWSSLSDPHSK